MEDGEDMTGNAEQERIDAAATGRADWGLWGPYLSDRAWGTVREDYSADGNAWDSFPHDHARSRAYRWNEDGLAGISDRSQYLCFGIALWNGEDPILKERLFGLTGPEGNHGEDVKELYYHLDATPTHSLLTMRYRYPLTRFPYEELVAENRRRGATDPEYELLDTGVFDGSRYVDVDVTYAKAAVDDVLIAVEVTNRGSERAELTVLPTLWFRNTWSWGYPAGPMDDVPGRPELVADAPVDGGAVVVADHPVLGRYRLAADGAGETLFTENETNGQRLYGLPLATPYVKDSFHRYLVDGETDAVNPARRGTKAAFVHRLSLEPGSTRTIRLRLASELPAGPFDDFDEILARRREEADRYHESLLGATAGIEERRICRQAIAGLIWSQQLYYYDVRQWLRGDPAGPPPPAVRRRGRNHDWEHLNTFDVISMPDTWEYPWFAAWDLAFHAIPLALLDPTSPKRQLRVMTREWYMHPNGQIPAYEWAFGDANPPVHAWAARRVYEIQAESGRRDVEFLKAVFHKLLLDFTWWVNRKDADGNNVFQGGFLGLDNISVFDRSAELPTGGHIDQSDGTAWMAFSTLEMLKIALELSRFDPVYQDLATKFFEHFLAIAEAIAGGGGGPHCLWDPEDGFYYDLLHLPDGTTTPLKVRSLVGLMPLLAVAVADGSHVEGLSDFEHRTRWFLRNRPEMREHVVVEKRADAESYLVSVLSRERIVSLLRYMLDEDEFLSPYGIRSLSRYHRDHPFRIELGGRTFEVGYEPAESTSPTFGGNSNWRGPVWFPINFLLIEALRELDRYYGRRLQVEMPTGSGVMMGLGQVADELSRRLVSLFLPDASGRRPAHGAVDRYRDDPDWRDLVLFHEYFDGDTGAGLGASHQTGWTALVVALLHGAR